jgi:hypothetical protein
VSFTPKLLPCPSGVDGRVERIHSHSMVAGGLFVKS